MVVIAENLHDHQTDPGLMSESIPDGDLVPLEGLGTLVCASQEERAIPIPDLLGDCYRLHPDLVAGRLVLVGSGCVLDEDDLEIAIRENDLQNALDISLCSFLPLLWR